MWIEFFFSVSVAASCQRLLLIVSTNQHLSSFPPLLSRYHTLTVFVSVALFSTLFYSFSWVVGLPTAILSQVTEASFALISLSLKSLNDTQIGSPFILPSCSRHNNALASDSDTLCVRHHRSQLTKHQWALFLSYFPPLFQASIPFPFLKAMFFWLLPSPKHTDVVFFVMFCRTLWFQLLSKLQDFFLRNQSFFCANVLLIIYFPAGRLTPPLVFVFQQLDQCFETLSPVGAAERHGILPDFCILFKQQPLMTLPTIKSWYGTRFSSFLAEKGSKCVLAA